MALRALHLSHLPAVLPRKQPALDTAPENVQGTEEFIGPQLEQLCDTALTHQLGDCELL